MDPLPTHYTASAKSSAGYDDITKLFNGLLSHLKCKSPGARASLQASQRIAVLDALGCLYLNLIPCSTSLCMSRQPAIQGLFLDQIGTAMLWPLNSCLIYKSSSMKCSSTTPSSFVRQHRNDASHMYALLIFHPLPSRMLKSLTRGKLAIRASSSTAQHVTNVYYKSINNCFRPGGLSTHLRH